MSLQILKEIRTAITNLNPHDVQTAADRAVHIGLVASSPAGLDVLEEFLLPSEKVSYRKRTAAGALLHRAGDQELPEQLDIVLCEPGYPAPPHAFIFDPGRPDEVVREILAKHDDLSLALARNFYPFRQPVVEHVIHSVSRDNALFALVTALPDVIPSLVELPWSVTEFASDTAFLTMNQIRMAFLIAAASDKQVGYTVQKAEIASIVTGAFGFRALARELAGKIPFGGGLIPKGAIAFAATYVEGLGLDRLHRLGYGLSSEERRNTYQEAFERGKGIVETAMRLMRNGDAA